MSGSILNTVKKACGLDSNYTAFDIDILMHINSVFGTLHQLGIGPPNGYEIEDAVPTWSDYILDDPRYNSIKSYMVLNVRMLFDPPATSFLLTAMKEQIQELTWRINVVREEELFPEVVEVVNSIEC